MGIFARFFGDREEREYRRALADAWDPLMERVAEQPDEEIRQFFRVAMDAAERSLRGILFMSPDEFSFKKPIATKEVLLWLRKVCFALVAYSSHALLMEGASPSAQASHKTHWQRILGSYNSVFREKMSSNDLDRYAGGLREDAEKGFSSSGHPEKAIELAMRDYKTIGRELLQEIWPEYPESGEKASLFIGARIWQAHQQIVQPFLLQLFNR